METEENLNHHDYQARTLKANSLISQRRRSLLPAYPTHKYDLRPPLLLLANVVNIDRKLMETLSYPGHDPPSESHGPFCPFQFQLNLQHEFIDSFLIDFYQKLYVETSQRWKVHLSLIDYNLTRLHKCMTKYSIQVGQAAVASIDELPLALEFYLQIDVDLFFHKTCDYRDAQPRFLGQEQEGLFCQMQPSARYGTKPCNRSRCFLCEPERNKSGETIMQFSDQQMHRCINTYEIILNCPATCYTDNVIYALTCACGEYDYIGSTANSFIDRISEHREEGHRIIREFLLGPQNINHILNQDKRKVEPLAIPYDRLLYQHSARCRFGLQRFLKKNPIYWCFVPQLSQHVTLDNDAYLAAKRKNKYDPSAMKSNPFGGGDASFLVPEQTASSSSGKPMLFAAIVADMVRNEEETQQLVRNVPDPPMGYKFSIRQKEEQWQFFQGKKEMCVFPSNLIDLYNYSIITVLPDNCSRDLRKFIEALFITHAETKLNLIGRLTHEQPGTLYDSSNRGNWCSKVLHPLFDQDKTLKIASTITI